MRETPRPQGTAGDTGSELPQRRPGCAFAHTTGASGSGTPHRSDGRPPHTPRGARHTGPAVRPGTTPPGAGPGGGVGFGGWGGGGRVARPTRERAGRRP
ncbi:hypothetical protein ACFV6Z_30870, partial [Streptomyces sp. NPDC059818]